MIKRRFYRLDHGDNDDASDSSSDSELEVDASEESENDVEVQEDDGSHSTSSGYESEDSSVNEADVDSSGLPSTEDDPDIGNKSQTLGALDLESEILSMKEPLPGGFPECILKRKSVFKCRLCPRVVCLNEETLKAHLKCKRHARAEKLLNEGRLKIMLNDNGEIENSAESPPRLPAFPPDHHHRRKNKSQQSRRSQTKRSNKKEKKHMNGGHQMKGSTGKKRRKIE